MRILLFVLLAFTIINVRGQTDSIVNRESRSEQIAKGRKLLLDEVLNANKTGITELTNYLVGLEDEHYAAFYPAERWLLDYWVEDYPAVLRAVARYDLAYRNSLVTKNFPAEDYLFPKLREQMRKDRLLFLFRIEQATLTAAEKEFLTLNLNYLLMEYDDPEITQDVLNAASNDYLSKYPASAYETFIREYIRYQVKPSRWGFAFEFFSGYGIFTDDLADHFKNNVPIGVAFDVSYKRWVLFLRDYIGFSHTSHALTFEGGTWLKDAQTRIFLPEATLGYVIRDLERIKVIPFAGIASTSITPTEHDIDKYAEYENVGLDFTTTFCYGINLDLKRGKPQTAIIAHNETAYWFIRLRYAYNQPQFTKKYDGYSGNMHYITLGFGGFGRRLKRDR